MNKNKNKINLIWIAIIFLAIGIVVGFLVSLNTSKTGDAMKAISNSKVGAEMKITDNFSIKKTQDGVVTTYIQKYEDEKRNIVTEKYSTLITDAAQPTCHSSCSGDSGNCLANGCDITNHGGGWYECTTYSCGHDGTGVSCSSSCNLSKISSLSANTR